MPERSGARGRIAGALAVALAAGLLWLLRPPAEGPRPVAWDRVRCARCGMLVGDPAFAAQVQLRGGEVLHFDDPGCLLLYRHERAPDARAVYFHHALEMRWIPAADAVFREAGPTPMGYGLGAEPRGAGRPGAGDALSAEDALARAREREAERRSARP